MDVLGRELRCLYPWENLGTGNSSNLWMGNWIVMLKYVVFGLWGTTYFSGRIS
jgi:hypothetical protein